jgi:hypothetical protein
MPASLLAVPQELLDKICEGLNYASTLALKLTCRDLYVTVSTYNVPILRQRMSYGMSDLLEIEKWPCYDFALVADDHMKQPLATRDYFACSYCLKIRCASKFSNAMMKGKKGKHSQAATDSDEKQYRFCIDCGVKYARYLPGATFEYGGAWLSDDELGGGRGVICYGCHQFRRTYSEVEEKKRTCRVCLEI